ncbi:VAN3-binding protein-like isoform X2 [Oryza glaberrima]|nr:VAN3-binding protein-like isoform X2 [Oryza glaberrima]XP_052133707.1 VAN3-binding protein-like isoform X2 [Oryza glaberrima]XP_052133708.1 VAN3-binding protein-like isoform X2 [Oryza glaberrima]
MPIIPEQAMEFLSRTWSPSSSDFFQTLRTSSEHRQPEKAIKDEEGNEEKDEERHLSTVNFSGGKSQFFNQTWQLNAGYMKAILRGHFLSAVSVTGRQRKKRKEELRLHAAQARAAVSVAQLAAAIAGIVSVCELRPDNLKYVEAADSKKMGTVLASAAALVATVCTEAAELAGTNRSGVTSAVKTGVESCSSAELLTLTATAATCLRGAAALKLRADVRGIGSNNNSVGTSTTSIHKDTTLRVRLPCGSVRLRKVAVFPQCDRVVLRLGKKHLHGAFSTYKNYEVLDVSSNGGDVVVDGMVLFPLVLRTAAGVVQLLLDSQMHCKVWKNAIEGILSDQNVKHAKL